MPYTRSPLTYNGNKYRLLKQIIPLFPENIDIFYDLFCGSGVVSLNIKSKKVVANDVNTHLIEIFKEFQKYSNAEDLITDIEKIIKDNKLAKNNEEAFYKFREKYNKDQKPLDLFVLSKFAFNSLIRFNSKGEFNLASGRYKSQYNDKNSLQLRELFSKIKAINFTNKRYNEIDSNLLGKDDFIYVDPPYLHSTAIYNDNKQNGLFWNEE